MTLTRKGDELLCSLGYYDILVWASLYIGQSGEYLYGYDYQRLLKDAVLDKCNLVNAYVRISSIVLQGNLSREVIETLAVLFAFNYYMPQFNSLSHLQFLEWVVSEITKFISEEGIVIDGIRESCVSNPSSAVSEPLCLASFGLHEFEEWQFTLSCREDRFSRRSFRNRLLTMKKIELNAFVSIQVRIQQFVEQKELHPRFQKTVARCCAESDHQPEYLEKDPIEFLLWVKAEMESLD